MQHTDIESAVQRPRIIGHKIIRHGALPKTLAVKRNVQLIEPECFRAARIENMDAARKVQTLRYLTFGVVVAVQQLNWDVRGVEPAHLRGKEQTCFVVAPVAIIEVAGNYQKADLLLDREANKPIKGFPGRGAHTFGRAAVLPGQTFERAV
jgi:hypothetical protein